MEPDEGGRRQRGRSWSRGPLPGTCVCVHAVCVCIQRGEGPGPHIPQDPRCGPLCLPTHEIKYVATETHTLGRAQKMRRFGNPVSALKKCWESEEADKPEASGAGWSRALEHRSHRPERTSLEKPEALRGPQGNGPALAKPNKKVTVTRQPAPDSGPRKVKPGPPLRGPARPEQQLVKDVCGHDGR